MKLSAQRFRNPQWMDYRHDGRRWTSFSEYPLARGFRANFVTHNVALGGEPATEIESFDQDSVAFYQSWYTFGFLEAIIEDHVPEKLLLTRDNENKFVMSLDNLSVFLRCWAVLVHERAKEKKDFRGYLDRATATHRQLHVQHQVLIAKNRFHCPGADYLEILSLINYIGCIGEAVSMTASGLYYRLLGPTSIPSTQIWSNIPILADPSLHGAVVADGWCPSTINYLNQTTNMTTLRLALRRGPYRQEQHRNCSSIECTAYEVDVENYVARHTLDGCECDYARPDVGRITELLKQKSVPVLTASVRENNQVSVSVGDGSRIPFVALSHVWVDGLGSTSEIGLPSCQIRRLMGLASKLVDSGAFWIDALCVPGDIEVRKLAIRMMADTYRKAATVLVLDSGILESPSTMELKEKLVCIQLSGWKRRLWTLQEAALASKLVFQFSDTSDSIKDLIPPFKDQLVDPVLTDLGLSMAIISAGTQDKVLGFSDVVRAVTWRSTSRASDETLAFASLLELDAFELANVAPGERMKALFLKLHDIPKGILFLALPRLETEGFRWAPSTFLYPGAQQMSRSDEPATCTTEGLIAEYYALCFDELLIEQEEQMCFVDPRTNQPYFLYTEKPSSGAYHCNTVLLSEPLGPGATANAVAVLCKTPSQVSLAKVPKRESRDVSGKSSVTAGEVRPESRRRWQFPSILRFFDLRLHAGQGGPKVTPCVFQRRILIVRLASVDTALAVRSVKVKSQGPLKVCIS